LGATATEKENGMKDNELKVKMQTISLPSGTFEYDPKKPLGRRGGFGQVFLGRLPSGHEVAVKKLHLSAADAAHRELRIADELRGRSFNHVISFIDAGEDANTGDYFVVMPKADGSLQNKVDKDGALSPPESAAILLQIADGLIEVGDLVHRDLKPDNVLFHEGKWKLADFGIARFVEDATSLNTLKDCLSPPYAAPEQWRFERATHETDIYALGCIGFFLLTGRPPFTKDPQKEHQSAPVPAFACTEPRLTTVINMCLRKVPGGRPSLSRVRGLLAEIVTKPQPLGSPGSLAALSVAAAHVSSKEQAAQARLAEQTKALEARSALGQQAQEVLVQNIERLWGKIQSHAPNARRVAVGGGKFECSIGEGQLIVNLSSGNSLEPNSFPHSGWDVVRYSQILVIQRQPRYCWAASLWFSKMPKEKDYRWYEASYWSMRNDKGGENEPYAEAPGRDADMAASNIMCGINFAFGPTPVDDEMEDEFHERWTFLLSRAAVGQLRRPSRMPFGWPPPI
jgi:eukaryotic-like serine/threonine-protein kinase